MTRRPTRHTHSPFYFFALSSSLVVHYTLCSMPASAVTIPTVPVGNAGNAADITGYGSVAYNYRIGTYEVTNAQYAEFLNAKAKSDPLNLYHTGMASAFGGIVRSGSSGNYSYTVTAGRGNKPVNYVTWYDAIRFVNWLHNGQGPGDTESGAYTLLGGTPVPSNAFSITRNAGARWWLPSENEWYKAAYYDPSTNSYFDYPTSSNTAPTAEPPPGGSKSANFNSAVGNLTDVGAYTASASPYGTFDQAGNVWEWNETLIDVGGIPLRPLRGLRGGSWASNSHGQMASHRDGENPTFGNSSVRGFRVATVPEPSTVVLGIVGCMLAWVLREGFR